MPLKGRSLCRALVRECQRLGRNWTPKPPASDELWGRGIQGKVGALHPVFLNSAPSCIHQQITDVGTKSTFIDWVREELRRELKGVNVATGLTQASFLDNVSTNGVEVLEFLRWQSKLVGCTSSSEQQGLRVDGVSGVVENNSNAVEGQHLFAYNMRFTNTSQHRLRILSRQYDFYEESGQVVKQIEATQPEAAGVVGVTPCLGPGEVFDFGSGTMLHSPRGFLTGSFLVMHEPVFFVPGTDVELHKQMEEAELVLRVEYMRSLDTKVFRLPLGMLHFNADTPCISCASTFVGPKPSEMPDKFPMYG